MIPFSSIVEANGKTIRQNNLEIPHNIPIGALVQVKFDRWHGDGACERTEARLWVVEHMRDCDGTPLYCLCKKKPPLENLDRVQLVWPDGTYGEPLAFSEEVSRSIVYDVKSGFNEESLTVVEVTEDVKRGVGALEWPTPTPWKE